MRKLIVYANPVAPFEVFEKDGEDYKKISQYQSPQAFFDFAKNYSISTGESTEIAFIGPKVYVDHLIEETDKFEFINATFIEE